MLPHPERRILLTVTSMEDAGARTPLLTLAPLDDSDCLCQFIPGQYLMLEGTACLARAYPIGSAPRPDGTIKLQIRRRTRAASPDGSLIKPSHKTMRPHLALHNDSTSLHSNRHPPGQFGPPLEKAHPCALDKWGDWV